MGWVERRLGTRSTPRSDSGICDGTGHGRGVHEVEGRVNGANEAEDNVRIGWEGYGDVNAPCSAHAVLTVCQAILR